MPDRDEPAPAELLRAIAAMAPREGVVDETLLRAIVTHMPATLAVIDPRGYVLWANKTDIDASVEEVVGRSMFEFMQTADQADARAALERVVRDNLPDRYVGHGPGLRGPRSRYDTWLGPIARDGQVFAVALVTRDVSKEWELHAALRDREQRLALVLRAAGMGTWRFDARTSTLEFDDHALAIYGLTTARLGAQAFTTTHIHPEDRIAVDEQALAAARERRAYTSQNRVIRSDGQVRWVEVTGSPIVDDHGELAGLMGTVTDITDRRELDRRMLQAQRVDAVGQLTAGLAHNFNNLLAAIMPTLSMLARHVEPSALPLLEDASQATARAADLIRQLMTFAGHNHPRSRAVAAPGALIERTVQLCRSTFDREITLHVEIEPDLPGIRVDGGQIEQAVLNLLLNARDAVRDARVAAPAVWVRVSFGPAPGVPGQRRISVVVEDNGPGVPEAIRERVFDPFFTTKPVGVGTGLGLSTAYAIARAHGGDLQCGGAATRGARFTLSIPAIDAAPVPPSPDRKAPSRVQGSVLVVDDDALVCGVVASLLDSEGFTVAVADSADRALVVLANSPTFAVVLLDLNMPGSSWRTVVAALRHDHPTTRVIAFTGGMTPRDATVDDWLIKPATPEAIIDTIVRVIDRAAPRHPAGG